MFAIVRKTFSKKKTNLGMSLVFLVGIFSVICASAEDKYTLKLERTLFTVGVGFGVSSLQSSPNKAILLRNGKEIFRLPVNMSINHYLILGASKIYDLEFEISGITPTTTIKSLLATYSGYYSSAQIAVPQGPAYTIAKISVSNKQNIILHNSHVRAAGYLVAASYTTLGIELDQRRVISEIPKELDQPIYSLKEVDPQINIGIHIKCVGPNTEYDPNANMTTTASNFTINSYNIDIYASSSSVFGVGHPTVYVIKSKNFNPIDNSGVNRPVIRGWTNSYQVKDGAFSFKLVGSSIQREMLGDRGFSQIDSRIYIEDGQLLGDFNIESKGYGNPSHQLSAVQKALCKSDYSIDPMEVLAQIQENKDYQWSR
jgi:hypothetical protein